MGCLSFFVIVAVVAAAVAIDRTMKARQRLDDLGARVAMLEDALAQLARRLPSRSPATAAATPAQAPSAIPVAPPPPVAAESVVRVPPPRGVPLPTVPPLTVQDAVPPASQPRPVRGGDGTTPLPVQPVLASSDTNADRSASIEKGPGPPSRPQGDERSPVDIQGALGRGEEPTPETPGPGLLARLDLERLVGVRMFSAVAGLALVVAAVLFLRYSIDQGWLGPPIRFAIGLFVGVGLLVLCEQRAARRYAVTANALDAAAIAVLFSTFYAAHALWDLIPALPTFGFLALVAALAVILSIRRDSQFIAVLGLLGGFATPALLSTGENQPAQLFSYLLLLNVGLAWLAYRMAWPLLSWLTLGLTTIYQWGWVMTFLTAGQLPLASGIFLMFPASAFAVRVLATGRIGQSDPDRPSHRSAGQSALLSAVMPLVFVVFLSAVPGYGAQFHLLFGLLFLVAAGLFALAVAHRTWLLHATGGVATLLTFAVWLNASYANAAWPTVLLWLAVFVVSYAVAGPIATRMKSSPDSVGRATTLVAPALLFVPAGLVLAEPATSSPGLLFGALFSLLIVLAVAATWQRDGWVYFTAAFLVVAAEVNWSLRYLTGDGLGPALVLYGVTVACFIGVPVVARRMKRPLEPVHGAGVLLLTSVGLMVFLTRGPVAPAALWGLALLLAGLNAGLFVEAAAVKLPWISLVGCAASWVVLGLWWVNGAADVPLLPSLTVVVGLALVMLAGHAWQRQQDPAAGGARSWNVWLALPVFIFVAVVAVQPALALPPWPIFAALAVLLLAFSATSLHGGEATLHVASVMASMVVLLGWTTIAADTNPWPLVAMLAPGVLVVFCLGWIAVARRAGDRGDLVPSGAIGAVVLAQFVTTVAATKAGTPGIVAVTFAQVALLVTMMAVASRRAWHDAPFLGIATMVLAVALTPPDVWWHRLLLGGALYMPFVLYPIVLGTRAATSRAPCIAAIVTSAVFFLVGRDAMMSGGLSSVIGLLPVAQAVLLAALLRQLLSLQAAGSRDQARLALVAGASLAFVTVAIPLQLDRQWITIGWALEGAALVWLFRRIPHPGLFWTSMGLFVAVFLRLVTNPAVLTYATREAVPILNWYLYAYGVCAIAMFVAARWLKPAADALPTPVLRASNLLTAAGGIILFVLLNIEIADFFSEGATLAFRFGMTVAQDLTYTIGWLLYGMALLVIGIAAHRPSTRVASLLLITVTVLKCFLYDLSSLEGLYRVASFAGLAVSLALVSVALQKYVLGPVKGPRRT
jgi:uncharacterized membrane protein